MFRRKVICSVAGGEIVVSDLSKETAASALDQLSSVLHSKSTHKSDGRMECEAMRKRWPVKAV
jgi:hypothetical protein